MTAKVNRFAHLKGVALSDIGCKRKNNEDSFGAFPEHGIWCVADGMGGGDDGEVASAAVVKSVDAYLSDLPTSPADGAYAGKQVAAGVVAAVEEASGWIYRRTKTKGLKGCGSTFVGVVFDATVPDAALALHVGDSRLYRLRGKELKQITKDHSVAEMMGAKDEKDLNPMFRGMILRAVGIESMVEVDQTPLSVEEGDVILVCSDGLSRMVPDRRIGEIIREGGDDVEATVRSLIAAANEAGGVDNITVALVKVGALPAALPPVNIARNDDSHPSSSTMQTLDREYGASDGRKFRRALFAAAIAAAVLAFGWLLLSSAQRKPRARESVGPLIELHEPNAAPDVTPPSVAADAPESEDAAASAPTGSTAAVEAAAPETNATAEVEAAEPESVTNATSAVPAAENIAENTVRNAIEEELKAARERRKLEETAAAERDDANRRATQELTKAYESDFAPFAAFFNSIFGKGTCDRAETLCRRLNLKRDDVDAALCAADLTAEVQALAKRLKAQCTRRKGVLLKDTRIAAIVGHCDALGDGDPSGSEAQRKCFEFIRFIAEIRTESNGRK